LLHLLSLEKLPVAALVLTIAHEYPLLSPQGKVAGVKPGADQVRVRIVLVTTDDVDVSSEREIFRELRSRLAKPVVEGTGRTI